MTKLKRIVAITFSLILCTILFGCGTVELKSSAEIKSNESGTAKLQIIYDNGVSSYLNGTIFNQQLMKENGFTFNNYTKDKKNVEEVKYDFKNLKDLQDKINLTNIIKMSYSKKTGMGNDIYTINVSFDKSAIDNLIKKKINTGDKQKDEQIYNNLKESVLSNDIKIPGTIINSNSTEKVDENTYEWNYKLSQIDENTDINISYTMKNNLIPGILATGVAIVLGALGYIFFKKNKLKKQK